MTIRQVSADALRHFEKLRLDPHPHINILRGENATGKTTVLEAVYLGARAASFRSRRLDESIREGQAAARVVLSVSPDCSQPPVHWQVNWKKGEAAIRRLGVASNRKELAIAIPVALVDRQLHRVFEDGPIYRRRYLDWGLFYVEPSFFELWRRYERALRQRNQALRSHASAAAVQAWNPELILTGTLLLQLRQQHAQALEDAAKIWLADLLEVDQFRLQLVAGWDEKQGLEAALAQGLAADRKTGYTHAGPHRAELRLRFEGREARSFVSRGQQKMLAVAMVLAQAGLVAKVRGQAPTILLDDLEAELATSWQRRVLAALHRYPGQSLITSLEWRAELAPPGATPDDYSVFHVEHGHVTRSAGTA